MVLALQSDGPPGSSAEVRFYKSVAWLVFKFSKNMPSQPSLRLTWSLHAANLALTFQMPLRRPVQRRHDGGGGASWGTLSLAISFGPREAPQAADIRAKEREMASIKARPLLL